MEVAGQRRMGFDAAADQHVIGLAGRAIDVQGKPFGRTAHDRGFHARTDRAADRCLGDAVRLQHLPLAFGRAAAVAAHGRHEERFGPQRAEMFRGRPQDHGDVGDPAAAGRDGDALPRLHAAVQFQPGQLGMDLAGDVCHPRPGKILANAKDLGEVGHVNH